ncbi:M23 family metallopeptidase [Montanilutibacter psychrotolerans]
MTFKINTNNPRVARLRIGTPQSRTDIMRQMVAQFGANRPGLAVALLLGVGMVVGVGGGLAMTAGLRAQVSNQQAQMESTRRDAQREINALAARLGELQAEANRLNALGVRLTRIGQLQDGEFNFDKPVGVGGAGPVQDMPKAELDAGLSKLKRQFAASGEQLSVLESLLFNRQLDMNSVPSREPIANSYITSGFGGRADPFNGGRANHKGIDFEADVGDPVLAVADGVVSYSGVRSGYGNVVEVDHGNGYVTRYAHNSRLTRTVGQLVRAGQEIAKAGSTGRSTGAHVHFEVWENGRVVDPRNFLAQESPLKLKG